MIFILFFICTTASPLEPDHLYRRQYRNGICDVDLTLDPTFINKHGLSSHQVAANAVNKASSLFSKPFGVEFNVSNIKHLQSSFGTNAETALSKFKQSTNAAKATNTNTRKPCMNVMLTSQDFNSVVGLAYVNKACSDSNHLLVSSHKNIVIGDSLAHEMGHAFGADHDSGTCADSGNPFIMHPSVQHGPNSLNFSKCSINQINSNMRSKTCIR